ncbi:MAG: hypothetical protein SWY16_15110 [Cyanobacteriota bacterium]|nr:hypothetical protein [Cyanobacteriota bacterium]
MREIQNSSLSSLSLPLRVTASPRPRIFPLSPVPEASEASHLFLTYAMLNFISNTP